MPRFTNRVFKKRKQVGKPKVVYVASNSEPEPSLGESSGVTIHSNEPNAPMESVSSKKISGSLAEYSRYKEDSGIYDIVNLKSLQNLLNDIVVCTRCSGSIQILPVDRLGISTKIVIKCNACEFSVSDTNSKILDSGKAELNVRLVYAFRCIGLGQQGAELFCGTMNMACPTEFNPYNKLLHNVTKEVCLNSMKTATEEALLIESEATEEINERILTIALDGTWQKRGHSSQNGVVTAISVSTGKVVDAEILSKFCRCKNKFNKEHEDKCSANYLGSIGGMEVTGVKNIFLRSQEFHNVKYGQYHGYGDTAAFATIANLKPYGPDFNIGKLECVGHVQKRMGTRLRTLKAKSGKEKLSDGKTIGGRGRLTDSAIQQITTYYGLAIRRNVNSLPNMKQAVWALYFHLVSSDLEPAHGLCPKDPDTWCKYQKAMIDNEEYRHKDHFHLPTVVMETIKPIFKDLSNPQLLKRCFHGGTQNPSESLNNMIWSRIPKRTFVMLTTLELGVYEAIACFNQGNIARCKIFEKLGIVPGVKCVKILQDLDNLRVIKANNAIEEIEKKCRQKTSLAKRKLEDNYEAEEDPDTPSYGAGMH